MLKIGEFSRLSQVTVKTLHHYDEIALLKPAHIDRFTNHRYYTIDQLPRIHRVMALKELGLSLEQIALMLDDTLDVQQIRGMLRLKQAEIQQRVRQEQTRLGQVEFRLRMMEVEDKMPDIEMVIKRLDAFRALTLRRVYATAESFQREGDQLQVLTEKAGVQLSGPPMEIHYGDEFILNNLDVELVGPIDETWTENVPVGALGTFVVREIPALEIAATHIHDGSFEKLPEKAALVQRWAVENDYRLCGVMRLIHHRGILHYKDENNLTEIQHEIERAELPE